MKPASPGMEAARRLLRWLDTINSAKGARAGTLALADQLAASATNFLTGVIVGRACAPQEFGLYMLGFSIVFLAMRLQTALISTPYMVFSPQLTEEERKKFAGSILVHQFGITALAMVALVVAGIVIRALKSPHDLADVLFALTFAIGFILLRDFVRNICFSHLNFMAAFFLDCGIGVVQICGLLGLARVGLLAAHSAFLVIGAACGLAVAVWFLSSGALLAVRRREVVPTFRRNWQFGRWIFASGLLWESGLSVYPWILTFFHGTLATGVWAACFGVVALGNPLLLGMQNYLGPRIAHAYVDFESAARRGFVMRSSLYFTLATLPIATVIAVAGGFLVILVYGEKYAGHGSVMLILALGLLLVPVRFALARSLFAMDRALLECATNLVPLVVLVTLGIWLVKSFSVIGVAFGLLLGDLLVTVAKLVVFELVLRTAEGRVDDAALD